MQWLHQLDVGVFRCVNSLASRNDFADEVMRFCAGNIFFAPLLILVAILAVWKGGIRGRICLLVAVVLLSLGDPLIWNMIKHAVSRDRPFLQLDGVHLLVGRGSSGSMPSAHAANWFAATMILFLYYRRSIRFMLPLALIVGFSRVYCGVHFPSDVLAGAILGAGYGVAGVWALNFLWQLIGKKFFPLWHQHLPSLLQPKLASVSSPSPPSDGGEGRGEETTHWLRLGYVIIFILLFARLAYIAGDTIELSGDEAYYWMWSKHPALSYFSKPLLIACTHLLGTTLFGDTAFGVRFFSPVIAAALSFVLLRFFARNGHARAGFWLVLIVTTTPMLAAGAVLMTIDPLSVLFWTAAMLAGWRAIQENSTTRHWLWVGLWMGLGFLSKYTALFQFLSFALLFALWPPARKQLKRAGPYLAVLITLICTLPVLIWNSQHGWITVSHVADDAKAGEGWNPAVIQFLSEEAGVLHPVFFLAMIWAAVAFWRRGRNDPLKTYFFSMGAPLFLCYFLYSFHSRIQPNWIVPAVVPLFCLMTLFWGDKMKSGAAWAKSVFAAALIVGAFAVTILHDTDLTGKLFKASLPGHADPLQRVRGWREAARIVGEARQNLFEKEGLPVFIIGNHYATAAEISFHLPEARTNVPAAPLVFSLLGAKTNNQFYFWPGYKDRKGHNAIFARDISLKRENPKPPPKELTAQFKSVTELGVFNVKHRKTVIRRIQIFACRDLQ